MESVVLPTESAVDDAVHFDPHACACDQGATVLELEADGGSAVGFDNHGDAGHDALQDGAGFPGYEVLGDHDDAGGTGFRLISGGVSDFSTEGRPGLCRQGRAQQREGG